MNIHLSETNMYGAFIYKVKVDGETYDWFVTEKELEPWEKTSIINGYEEALNSYTSGGIEWHPQD